MKNKCNICGKFVKISECEITYINGITINSEYDFIEMQVICPRCKREYIINNGKINLANIEEMEEK